MAYKQNDCALYLDGVQIEVDLDTTIPECDRIELATNNQNTQQVSLFPTRLTNAELASLTTL